MEKEDTGRESWDGTESDAKSGWVRCLTLRLPGTQGTSRAGGQLEGQNIKREEEFGTRNQLHISFALSAQGAAVNALSCRIRQVMTASNTEIPTLI